MVVDEGMLMMAMVMKKIIMKCGEANEGDG